MTEDPADIDLDNSTSENVDLPAPRSQRAARLAVIALALVLASVGAYVYLRRAQPAAPSSARATPSDNRADQQASKENTIALPPLDETDPLIRQLVGHLSSHPTVAAWLTTDGLILNFVMVTTAVANGEIRNAELKAIGPVPPFRVREARDNLYLDPSSYRRYDRYADAISSVDARGAARLYATLKPRIGDAYRRLGSTGDNFDPVMERAIIELLKVPIIEGTAELEPKGIVYGFADQKLEGMTSAQKQLLRMGPQNVRRVQAKLREIADYLAIPASKLPPPSTP